MFSTIVFSSGVSTDTRSMHIDLQMFLASNQLVCNYNSQEDEVTLPEL